MITTPYSNVIYDKPQSEFPVSEKERTAKLRQIKGSESGQQKMAKEECKTMSSILSYIHGTLSDSSGLNFFSNNS